MSQLSSFIVKNSVMETCVIIWSDLLERCLILETINIIHKTIFIVV